MPTEIKRQAPISIVYCPKAKKQSVRAKDTFAQEYCTQAKDLWKQIDWRFWTKRFLVGLNLVAWGSFYLGHQIEEDPESITYSSMVLNAITLNTALFCSLGSAYRQMRVTDLKARACDLISELLTNQGDVHTQQACIKKFLNQVPYHQDMRFLPAEFAQQLLAQILLTVPRDKQVLQKNETGPCYHLVNDLLTYFQFDEAINNYQMVDKNGITFTPEETNVTLKDKLTKLANKHKAIGKHDMSQKPFYRASQDCLEGRNQYSQKNDINDLFSMAHERLNRVPSLSDVVGEGVNYLTKCVEDDNKQAPTPK